MENTEEIFFFLITETISRNLENFEECSGEIRAFELTESKVNLK